MLSQTESDISEVGSCPRVVVIGAGISGLTAAYTLTCQTDAQAPAMEVLLLDASPRAGGVICTYNLDDVILELGPDSFTTQKPSAIKLCESLGIASRILPTDERYRRTFVAYKNKLHPLPDGFFMVAPTRILPIIGSSLFSFQGKLRMAMDLFLPKGDAGLDESLTEFVTRRFGAEVLERVAQPMLGGIYTGDPDRLSMKSVMPRFIELEQKHGSVIAGLAAERGKHGSKPGESGARYSMFVTLDEGMNVLVNALSSKLPPGCLRTKATVEHVKAGVQGRPWDVVFSDQSALSADAVIIATSAKQAGHMLLSTDSSLSDDLKQIPYASSAVINLIYRRSDIPHALDGFGFVVPRKENRSILACSFSSVKWGNRTPADKVLLRVFIGGALQPDLYGFTDEQIECLLWEDLHTYLGLKALPLLSVISRFPDAMPQYNVGHSALVERIDQALTKYDGLSLAGNAYRGIGMPDCIASGQRAAQAVMSALATRQSST